MKRFTLAAALAALLLPAVATGDSGSKRRGSFAAQGQSRGA